MMDERRRTPAEAQARLEALLDELDAEGFSVHGWDDESLILGWPARPPKKGDESVQIAPRRGAER